MHHGAPAAAHERPPQPLAPPGGPAAPPPHPRRLLAQGLARASAAHGWGREAAPPAATAPSGLRQALQRVACTCKAWNHLLRRGPKAPHSWLQTPSTPSEGSAPFASLDRLKAQAAPTYPGAPPEQLGSLSWPL